MQDQLLLHYFNNAGFVVKLVLLMLIVASIVSWTIIFQRGTYLKKIQLWLMEFEKQFHPSLDIPKFYLRLKQRDKQQLGLNRIFSVGYEEYKRLEKESISSRMEGVRQAMQLAHTHEADRLEEHLALLASIGSTSPYIGLFGTVWGIMTSFHALGSAKQVSIAMVAPGISEALIATAMGLFAAIPAVLAYNRYVAQIQQLLTRFSVFQESFVHYFQQIVSKDKDQE